MDSTYEKITAAVLGLPPADSDDRDVVWVGESRTVGAARSQNGRVELFIAGPPVAAEIPRVRDALAHSRYQGPHGSVEATRIALPQGAHFDPVAAFLLTELLRNGVERAPQVGLSRTEAVIALAMEQAALEDQSLVGLVGELLCLHALMSSAPSGLATAVADAWAGHDRSARDLQLGRVGVEVKTTTKLTSTHQVQGFHQIEPGASVDGVVETDLRLLSIGIAWLPADSGEAFTLPRLVEEIAKRIERSGGSRLDFLTKVRSYGTRAGGYDHATDSDNVRYSQPFGVRFARLYDLLDPAVQVLRSDIVQGYPMTKESSVSFEVALPPVVSLPTNPVTGLTEIGASLASRMLHHGGVAAGSSS